MATDQEKLNAWRILAEEVREKMCHANKLGWFAINVHIKEAQELQRLGELEEK